MAEGATKIFLLAAAVAAASLWVPAAGQTGCTTALITLSPCLSYISGSSSSPSSSCCSQLASIVQSQPQCLCTVLNGGGSIVGITINQTQALALPGACKVQTPPVSECNAGAAGGPSGSSPEPPQAAPSTPTTPSATPEAPSSPSGPTGAGGGSKSTDGDSSDGRMNGSVVSVVFSALIFGLSLASFN